MILKLQHKDEKTAEQIVKLQRAAYKIEAELIGFDRIPPLLESAQDIRSCSEIFYGYFEDGSLAGIISYRLEADTLDIYRVAVHPDYFRRGIARRLICFLEQSCDADRVIVSTAAQNTPAVILYKAMGFCEVKQQEIEKDFYIISFEKKRV